MKLNGRITHWAQAWAGVTCLALLVACGGGGDDAPSGRSLLIGDDSTLAASALTKVSDRPVAAADISGSFLLSRLVVMFKSTATLGQANAAMGAVGATAITSSEPGSLLVVIAVPPQASVAALQAVANTLRTQPGVAFASPGRTPKSSVLPEFSPGIPVDTSALSHLLGNRFPAAWNARHAAPADCLPRSVNVYVLDKFGDPRARPDFFSQVTRSSFTADPIGAGPGATGHGFDVATLLAARFDADTPTGANPFADCVQVHAIEADGVEYIDSIRRALNGVAADPDLRVILTTSLNYADNGFCGPNADQICDAQSTPPTDRIAFQFELVYRAVVAAEWARLTRVLALKDKMLVTQSAGNVDDLPDGFLAQNYLGFRSAGLSSPAALATHLGELQAMLTDPALWKSATVPGLPDATFSAADFAALLQTTADLDPANSISARSLLIVDSGSNDDTLESIRASFFNFLGADVRAVGENVVLSGSAPSGTSFSTPLVAGLAAYLWNLAPSLAAQPVSATADLLKRSSVATPNSSTVPLVDAYAAVLQLDDVPGCCSGALFAPTRLGLMDVDGDGGFTGLDLQKFADAYGLSNPNTPSIPTARDYSRFDLNGDGFTGGIPIATFDLDANGLDGNGKAKINSVDLQIEGFPVTFNEAALSDLQILCFYAYSPLYASDNGGQNDQLRTQLLGPARCVGARMNLQLAAQVAGHADLGVLVTVPSGNGQFAPAPNLLIEVTPSCGSVNPASGRTDASGQLTVTTSPGASCTNLTLDVVARANANTTPLVRQRVSALVSVAATFSGSVQRTVTTMTVGLFPSTSSDLTSVDVALQVDASGNVTLVSAGGTRVQHVSQQLPCHRPPNFTSDVFTASVDNIVTLLGGSAGGNLGGVGFQPFMVNVDAVIVERDPSISGGPVSTFNDCVPVTLHSSLPSNPVPTNIGFSGSPILDAQGGVIGFDFTVPEEIVNRNGTVTSTSFSGRLMR
jgi:hypothetical protein